MSTRARERSLRDQLATVVDVDRTHVAWWGLTWGIALLEGLSKDEVTEAHRTLYHTANGGPHSDTFMGRPRTERDPRTDAEWGAASAFRALGAIDALDGRLPGQALRVGLAWRGRWLSIESLSGPAARSVIFTIGERDYLARLEGDSPHARTRLAQALDDLIRGARPSGFSRLRDERTRRTPLAASVAVCLDVLHHDEGRHAHRRTWRGGGGPWLGVVRTPEMEIVTTCHLVVDGLGHALLTDRILETRGEPGPEGRTARAGHAGSRAEPPTHRRRRARTPLLSTGVAWRYLPEGAGRFPAQAYATGIALDRFYGRGGHAPHRPAFTPSFTVPVAPGQGDDRRMRRVLHGLLSVRKTEDGYETFEDFQERLGPWLARERGARGPLTRIASAVARSPLPARLKHLSLSNHHGPHPRIPSVEALSGRARLSSLRFPEAPPVALLIAASLPTLLPTPADPRGGIVLTLIHHQAGTTVTAFGTGRAGTGDGAEAFLDLWLRTLGTVQG